MKFQNSFDRRIFKAIQGSTASRPQTLMGILLNVDASERTLLSFQELSGGLERLVAAGFIRAVSRTQYWDTSASRDSGEFPGLSFEEFKTADDEYRAFMSRAMSDLEDDPGMEFVQRKLILRVATPEARWPTDEDEDFVEALGRRIEPIIDGSGLGEINGMEFGKDHIDLLIFGKATDSDVDQIYQLLAPTFREFPSPPGSCIVRRYEEGDREVESDTVPAKRE